MVAGPQVRVVYVVPADGPDRGADAAAAIWAELEEIDAWWRANDPSRTLNLDLARFPCGAQADLGFLRLAAPSATLAPSEGRFPRIRDELFSDLRVDTRHTKYLLYYDGPTAERNLCGEGGGSPGGTGLAILYLQSCTEVTRAPVVAHELLHALGALRGSAAPNACPDNAAHVCDSTGDILYPYAQPLALSSFVLDLNRNDYYGHSHPWFDVQDSPWLRRLDRRVALTVAAQGGGLVRSDVPGVACTATCQSDWNPSSEVVLTARPAVGRRFLEWRGACSGSAPRCDLLLDEATAVTAVFAPARFRLAVSVAGRGSVAGAGVSCSRSCAREVLSHRPVTLRATPAKGWRLRGWSGACHGSTATCAVPMTKATAVRATFVRRG